MIDNNAQTPPRSAQPIPLSPTAEPAPLAADNLLGGGWGSFIRGTTEAPKRSEGVAATVREPSAEHEREPRTALPGTVGTRTLADLPCGDPLPPLIGEFIAAEGTTVLYGPGGVGKGWLSVHFAWQLVKTGRQVMVIDFELHEGEWGRRARRMGWTEPELEMVHYRAPFGEDWTAPKGTLGEVAERLRADCDRVGVDVIILDSYTTATSTSDSLGGQAGAQEFYSGIARIGRPALVLAHVAGASPRFSDRPFGSVFVHNLARETWALEGAADETPEAAWEPGTYPPTTMALELRCKKRSAGLKPLPQFLTFNFFADGSVTVTTIQPVIRGVADLSVDVLRRAKAPMTVAAIAKAITADTNEKHTPETIRKTLDRNHGHRFKRTDAAPYVYSLA